jgi:hypothetical protein
MEYLHGTVVLPAAAHGGFYRRIFTKMKRREKSRARATTCIRHSL